LQLALQYRPDISQAVHDLRSSGVRLGVSQNELLPKLDLVLSTYVAGLEGDAGILQSLGNQFADGRPGYTVGTQFEMPLGNRAAKARQDRRQWELTKAVYDFRTVVETGLTDVELSVREAETSYREMLSKFQALVAAETESSYLEDRWKVLPGADRGTTLLLEDLLDSQQRLADAEGEFVTSQVAYSIALIRVRRSMGTLLIAQNPTQIEVESGSSQPTLVPGEDVVPPRNEALDLPEPPPVEEASDGNPSSYKSVSQKQPNPPGKTKTTTDEGSHRLMKMPFKTPSWFRR
jgi:outer membrane protein TolC